MQAKSELVRNSAFIFLALLFMLAVTLTFPISQMLIGFYFIGSLLVVIQALIVLTDGSVNSEQLGKELTEPDELIDMNA